MALAGGALEGATSVTGGLVVERVEPGRAGHRAGLRAGDVLSGWERATGPGSPTSGRLATPADLAEAEDVQAPLGLLTLVVERAGQLLRVATDSGELGLTTRPFLSPNVLAGYEAGRAGPRPERARAWRRAALMARGEGAPAAARWLFFESARAAAELSQRRPALEALGEGEALAGDDRALRIQALDARSRTLQLLAEPRQSAEAAQQAVELRRQDGPDGLSAAAGLEAAGLRAWLATDIPAAEGLHAQAMHIREALAPGSLAHAFSLRSAGNVAWARSNLDEAEGLLRRALTFTARHEPEGHIAGLITLSLGNVALNRGHFDEAEQLYRRVLDMRAAVAPSSLEVCGGHGNLGLLAFNRGDLETAERQYDKAHACLKEARPGEEADLGRLNSRGQFAYERGDFVAARQFYEQALEISLRIHGDSSFPLQNLGDVSLQAGDLPRARGYLERALVSCEKRYGRESVWYAEILATLGELANRQGEHAQARAFLERGLAIFKRTDQGSPLMARCLRALGAATEAAGELGAARERYEEARAILERTAPGTYMEAETLRDLGRLRRAQGAGPEGTALVRRAADILESSMARVGGGQEALSTFRALHRGVYRDLMVAELEMGRVDEALHVVERSRGRVLLEWLARRRVGVPEDVPPETRREAEDIDAEHGRIQGRLHALGPSGDAAEVDRLVGRLRELRQQRDQWEARLRERVPRYAALQYPVALDAKGVGAALDPGTVLLSYVVGPRSTHLFVAGRDLAAPRVYTIPAGAEELRRRVTAFRGDIRSANPGRARALRRRARALFDLLMAPAQVETEAASRILISADGPLHLLPFGALARKNGYVVEWRPLHFVNSVTLYAELRRTRRTADAAPARLLAFGDARPDPPYASRFPSLPGSRLEVRALERRFPGQATVYVGASASEGRALHEGGTLKTMHFATHAFVDERLPLDSALVLSPGPGTENGLLQAWEIFDGMRLDADLVTLSGCETALGKDMGGEGLMGLTRAFFYAGARSVLASLWTVSDRSTPELMERFYRHLARGATQDEALRSAQVEMIHAGGSRAHPFRWAAFQVFGDWR